MPTFAYRALQTDGTMAEGQLDAAGRPDALRQMETLGLRPVNLVEKAAATAKNGSALPAGLENSGISRSISKRKKSRRKRWKISRVCCPACWPRACP